MMRLPPSGTKCRPPLHCLPSRHLTFHFTPTLIANLLPSRTDAVSHGRESGRRENVGRGERVEKRANPAKQNPALRG